MGGLSPLELELGCTGQIIGYVLVNKNESFFLPIWCGSLRFQIKSHEQ